MEILISNRRSRNIYYKVDPEEEQAKKWFFNDNRIKGIMDHTEIVIDDEDEFYNDVVYNVFSYKIDGVCKDYYTKFIYTLNENILNYIQDIVDLGDISIGNIKSIIDQFDDKNVKSTFLTFILENMYNISELKETGKIWYPDYIIANTEEIKIRTKIESYSVYGYEYVTDKIITNPLELNLIHKRYLERNIKINKPTYINTPEVINIHNCIIDGSVLREKLIQKSNKGELEFSPINTEDFISGDNRSFSLRSTKEEKGDEN